MAAMLGEDWQVEDGNHSGRRKVEDLGEKGWELDLMAAQVRTGGA